MLRRFGEDFTCFTSYLQKFKDSVQMEVSNAVNKYWRWCLHASSAIRVLYKSYNNEKRSNNNKKQNSFTSIVGFNCHLGILILIKFMKVPRGEKEVRLTFHAAKALSCTESQTTPSKSNAHTALAMTIISHLLDLLCRPTRNNGLNYNRLNNRHTSLYVRRRWKISVEHSLTITVLPTLLDVLLKPVTFHKSIRESLSMFLSWSATKNTVRPSLQESTKTIATKNCSSLIWTP